MSTTPRAILLPRRARPFVYGHPWVFSGAIHRMEGEANDGDVVDLCDSSGHFIARGLFNSRSQIRVRLYTWNPEQPLDMAFFEARIRSAVSYRAELRRQGLFGCDDACRMIHSEGDGLSGLILDVYPPYGVVQFLALGLDRRRGDLLPRIAEIAGLQHLYERSDGAICRYEGLEQRRGLLLGQTPPPLHPFRENGMTFLVDLVEGHKTGGYLDQKENRARAAQWARPGRVLDAFSYTGAFGLHAARAGASIVAIDESARALEIARENAALQSVSPDRIELRKGSVVPELQRLGRSGERFDTILLDPPKFAHSRPDLERALRAYKEINFLALQLLESPGLLFTCSCSGAVTLEMFQGVLHEAAHDAGQAVQVIEVRSQAQDHPVQLSCPESRYLKCLVCRVS